MLRALDCIVFKWNAFCNEYYITVSFGNALKFLCDHNKLALTDLQALLIVCFRRTLSCQVVQVLPLLAKMFKAQSVGLFAGSDLGALL